MSELLTTDGLQKEFEKLDKMSCRPDFRKLPKGYITDEDKSVKWNRERVEKNNTAYDAKVIELKQKKNAAREDLYERIYKEIQDELKCTRKTASLIWHYAYDEGHSNGAYGVYDKLDEMMDIVRDILDAEKQKKIS